MKIAIAALIAAVLSLATTATSAGTIGVYLDRNATGCALTLHEGESATVHIVGTTLPSDPDGGYVCSGEFRIVGLPEGWIATSVRDNPEFTAVLGDPFQDGVLFAFASMQVGIIPLFTVELQATSEQSDIVLAIVRHVDPHPPWGAPYTCPWLQYCDALSDNMGTCVDGVRLFINAGGCSLGVDQRTWSAVRVLYR